MDTSKFGIGQCEGKIDEAIQLDGVKNWPREAYIFTKYSCYSNSSSRETDLVLHKNTTGSYQKQNGEKLILKNPTPKNSHNSKFYENLSTSTRNTAVINNEVIDNFFKEIRETGVEKLGDYIEFSTSYKLDCSCQNQNEPLFSNMRGEDVRLDVDPSILDLITDMGSKPFGVQDETISGDEVTKKQDSSVVPQRLSVLPVENGIEINRKFCPGLLENNRSVAKKKVHCKIRSKFFTRIGTLKVHRRVHTVEKPFHCKIVQNPSVKWVILKIMRVKVLEQILQ